MSVSVQYQPVGGLDAVGQFGLSGVGAQAPQSAADIQAKLTETILQAINLLINEIMKALQQQQQQQQQQGSPSSSGPSGAAGPSGAGAPQGASNAYKPSGEAQAPSAPPPVVAAAQTPAAGEVSQASGSAGGKAPAGMPADLWEGAKEAGQKTGVDPYILAAQMQKESQFGKALSGSPSAGDGLMQVEPGTRQAYAGKFEEKMGHAYDHNNPKDQIAMAGVILADKGGDATNQLQKYNGGDNWTPGTTDSYGREIKAQEYASSVLATAQQMKAAG